MRSNFRGVEEDLERGEKKNEKLRLDRSDKEKRYVDTLQRTGKERGRIQNLSMKDYK